MGFKPGELATSNMVTPCFLIVHPRGAMMWDTGENPRQRIQERRRAADGGRVHRGSSAAAPARRHRLHAGGHHLSGAFALSRRPCGQRQRVRRLHLDRAARRSGCYLRPRADTGKKLGAVADAAYFTDLAKSKTLLLKGEDHDVFGDGAVVIKFTPGHTPGHQSLFLKLAKTGPVLLSGDLYDYPEEITYKRIPSFDWDKEQTAKSRAMIEEFVKKNNAQLWIQHDYTAGIKRKIARSFTSRPSLAACKQKNRDSSNHHRRAGERRDANAA